MAAYEKSARSVIGMGIALALCATAPAALGCDDDKSTGSELADGQVSDAGVDGTATPDGGNPQDGTVAPDSAIAPDGAAEPDACVTQFAYQDPPLLDTSDHSSQSPLVDRAFEVRPYTFNGSDYIVVNYGNDLKWFNIDNPLAPQPGAESHWMYNLVDPDGDVDFNLWGFSFCDDCRWGMANFRNIGSIVFDAGTQGGPGFGSSELYPNLQTLGSFMFKKGNVQYLIVNKMDYGYPGRGPATLYTIAGTQENDITLVAELETPSGAFHVRSGARYGDYLYLVASSGTLPVSGQVVVVDISDPAVPVATATEIPCGAGYSPLSVDPTHGVLVVTQAYTGTKIMDLSADPEQPQLLAEITPPAGETIMAVTVSYPYLVAQNHSGLWMDVYDISDLQNPLAIDSNFWNDTNLAHNDYAGGRTPYDAAFSPDNSAIYAARHVVFQVFGVECQ